MKNKWINVKDKKPKCQQKVLVFFKNSCDMKIIAMAQYIPPKTVLEEDFIAEEWWEDQSLSEHDEKEDCYWVIEGWFEYSEEAEMQYKIVDKITHWMELPDFP